MTDRSSHYEVHLRLLGAATTHAFLLNHSFIALLATSVCIIRINVSCVSTGLPATYNLSILSDV